MTARADPIDDVLQHRWDTDERRLSEPQEGKPVDRGDVQARRHLNEAGIDYQVRVHRLDVPGQPAPGPARRLADRDDPVPTLWTVSAPSVTSTRMTVPLFVFRHRSHGRHDVPAQCSYGSVRAAALHNRPERLPEDQRVHRHCPVLDVPEIEPDRLLP